MKKSKRLEAVAVLPRKGESMMAALHRTLSEEAMTPVEYMASRGINSPVRLSMVSSDGSVTDLNHAA